MSKPLLRRQAQHIVDSQYYKLTRIRFRFNNPFIRWSQIWVSEKSSRLSMEQNEMNNWIGTIVKHEWNVGVLLRNYWWICHKHNLGHFEPQSSSSIELHGL